MNWNASTAKEPKKSIFRLGQSSKADFLGSLGMQNGQEQMKQIQEDKIILEFLKSLGPWRDFVVIGGGFALFIYKLYLADPKLENLPVGTWDIDSLISRKIPEISKKNIAKYLNEAGFTLIFKDIDVPATESYVKEIDGVEVEIEFLTDSATRDDKNRKCCDRRHCCSAPELLDAEPTNDNEISDLFTRSRKGGLSWSMDLS